ncbi:unnamed protein product [Trichogramma brassicae]|uniref:Uncharacterized protein n=1 Tax=Trichogramma brassicae TaxID=86971 RepID=A0A6H5HWW5_9HYME|nr:unnamed protein product [Trichogramma brassicae]
MVQAPQSFHFLGEKYPIRYAKLMIFLILPGSSCRRIVSYIFRSPTYPRTNLETVGPRSEVRPYGLYLTSQAGSASWSLTCIVYVISFTPLKCIAHRCSRRGDCWCVGGASRERLIARGLIYNTFVIRTHTTTHTPGWAAIYLDYVEGGTTGQKGRIYDLLDGDKRRAGRVAARSGLAIIVYCCFFVSFESILATQMICYIPYIQKFTVIIFNKFEGIQCSVYMPATLAVTYFHASVNWSSINLTQFASIAAVNRPRIFAIAIDRFAPRALTDNQPKGLHLVTRDKNDVPRKATSCDIRRRFGFVHRVTCVFSCHVDYRHWTDNIIVHGES